MSEEVVVATEEVVVAAGYVVTKEGTVAGVAVAAPEEEDIPEEGQA
jgi:hypothetical protein